MEVLKILIINLLFFCFLIMVLHGKHSKYTHLPMMVTIIFTLCCFMIQENKESAIYEEQSNYLKEIEKDSSKDLKESIFFEKCNYFIKNNKEHLNLTNLGVCSNKKVNKLTSYRFIADSPVTVLVRDGFAYNYTHYQDKKIVVILHIFKYSFFSLIPESRDIINKKINEHVNGVTYLQILEQMPLSYQYEFFGPCETFNCGITFKVVPGNQLPEGKIYEVKSFSEGVK